MKITVVIENNVPFSCGLPLLAEHGVSMLIETAGRRILYDTGESGAVLHNLTVLGIAPESLDAIVISHGHYDHTGGLLAVLRAARKTVAVYAHPGIFAERWSLARGGRRPIGIPYARSYITGAGGDWHLCEAPAEVAPGVWFSGAIPRVTEYERGDTRLVQNGEPDPHVDDTVLYCTGARGLVVVSGCAHSGLVNAVRHGFSVTGQDRLQAWIGGTHLGPVGPEQQERTIAQLVDWQPDLVAANHCTGFPMASRLQTTFGERFVPAFAGVAVDLD